MSNYPDLLKEITEYCEEVFSFQKVPKDPSKISSKIKFFHQEAIPFEYLLLRLPLRIIGNEDVQIEFPEEYKFYKYLNEIFTNSYKNGEVDFDKGKYITKYAKKYKEAENINIRNSLKEILPDLFTKIEWTNASYWCLQGGRMPLLANLSCEGSNDRIIEKRIQNFKNVWKIYEDNTNWLKKEKDLNTLNAFICEEAEYKKFLHIHFDDEFDTKICDNITKNDLLKKGCLKIPAHEKFKNTLLGTEIESNIDKNKRCKKYLQRIEEVIKNNNYEEYFEYATDFFTKYFSHKSSRISFDSVAVIIQNILLWNAFYKGKKSINHIYMIPISLENYIYGDLAEYTDFFKGSPVSILAIATNEPLVKDEETFSQTFTEIILSKALMLNTYKLIYYKNIKQKDAAIKSAIASIMSRNGSHNIGSHVLAAVGSHLSEIPDDQILFTYVQNRMDYIALVVTEYSKWSYPVWFVGDLMRRFYMQRNLLNYIASSEGLNAYEFQEKDLDEESLIKPKNKLLIKLISFNENNNNKEYIVDEEINKTIGIFKNDIQVAIPGGIVGQQAFYIIIENIIRNTSKHNWAVIEDDKPDNLEINIEFHNDKNKDYVKVTIYDNVSNIFNNSKPSDENLQRLPLDNNRNEYVAKNSDKNFHSLPIHQQINSFLAKSFLDKETGQLLYENWGLAEMKISAGFLNLSSLRDIADENKNILYTEENEKGLISALAHKDNGKYRLAYEFSIPKPKEILLVGFKDIDLSKAEYRNMGIYFTDSLDNQRMDYEFVIMDETNTKFITSLIKKDFKEVSYVIESFPYRLYCVSDKLLNDILNSENELLKEFIMNRIVFLDKNTFNEKIESVDNIEDFKIWLYLEWILKLIKKKDLDQKVLKLLIHLSGIDKNGSDKGIFKIVFNKFKDEILKNLSNPSSLDENQKYQLKRVNFFQFEDEKKVFDSFQKFIETWIQVSSIESNDSILLDLIKSFRHYYYIVHKLAIKYEENIETQPLRFYNESDSKISWKNIEINKKLNLEITEDEHEKDINISYNRHDLLSRTNLESESQLLYNEAISGSQLYFPLFNIPEKETYLRRKFVLQLIENALINIIIVDERVAQYKYANKEIMDERYREAKISIPYTVQLSEEETKVKLIPGLDNKENNLIFSKLSLNEYDILIIHQGVLEKLLRKSKENKDKLDPFTIFIDEIKRKIPQVFVTSGRGSPSNLPENAKFLAFSNIDSFIRKKFPEKYLLLQSLISITK